MFTREEQWAGEMVQRLRVLTALPEDLGSIPRTHIGGSHPLVTSVPDALFWPPWVLHIYGVQETHVGKTLIHKRKDKTFPAIWSSLFP